MVRLDTQVLIPKISFRGNHNSNTINYGLNPNKSGAQNISFGEGFWERIIGMIYPDFKTAKAQVQYAAYSEGSDFKRLIEDIFKYPINHKSLDTKAAAPAQTALFPGGQVSMMPVSASPKINFLA